MAPSRRAWTVRLIVFSLALGGLRDPRLFALSAAAAWAAVWLERPPLGPAAAWLPWLGWAAASTLASPQPLAGLPVLARWTVVLSCASLAASWDQRERAAWLKWLLITASGLAFAALVTGAGRGFRNGMTGLIPPYYNYTAFVLSAAAAACAAWLLHPRGPRGAEAKAAGAFCALAVATLLLSGSRGALLGIASATAVWSFRRWGKRAAAVAALAAVLAALAAAGGLLPGPVDEVLFKRYRPYSEARPRLWRAAAAVATDFPWLGTGPGNFAVGFRRHPVANEEGAARWALSTEYAHSEPLQAAAETGWAGLLLWLAGAAAAIGALFRRTDDDPVREACAASGAAMTAQLAVDNMLQIPALAALWLCALAIASVPSGGGRRWPRGAVLAGAALALLAWVPRTLAVASPVRAAALFPAEPGPREDLAYRALEEGKPAAAESNWAAAQRLEPFNAVYPWRRAQLAAAAGRWADAERLAAGAEALEPGFLNARLLRAEALLRLERAPEGRRALDAVRDLYAARRDVARGSGYATAIWAFEQREFDRVAVLAGCAGQRRCFR